MVFSFIVQNDGSKLKKKIWMKCGTKHTLIYRNGLFISEFHIKDPGMPQWDAMHVND
jgi:hypothetical protein